MLSAWGVEIEMHEIENEKHAACHLQESVQGRVRCTGAKLMVGLWEQYKNFDLVDILDAATI